MRRPPLATALPVLLLPLVGLLGCADDDASDARADQIRAAGEEAGLADEVVDVLVLAARGVDGTFQVTYPGEGGTALVVSQAPPDRRVDVVTGERVVESRVFREGVGYSCTPPADDATGALECRRSEGALEAPGAFTDDALDAFVDDLSGALDDLDLAVEERTIAEVDATCLVAVPKAGPTDGTGPGVETICVSEEGAQLLVDVGGERVVASAYTSDVPEGTFEV